MPVFIQFNTEASVCVVVKRKKSPLKRVGWHNFYVTSETFRGDCIYPKA